MKLSTYFIVYKLSDSLSFLTGVLVLARLFFGLFRATKDMAFRSLRLGASVLFTSSIVSSNFGMD